MEWPEATFPFMSLCVGTPPPLQRLFLFNWNKSSVVPHQISSLLNLTRLYIAVIRGEVSEEEINILASLPILISLTVRLSDDKGDSGVFHQGMQSRAKDSRVWSSLHSAVGLR